MQATFTLQPDPQDTRDYVYECDQRDTLPDSIDLRQYILDIEDQLTIGSCTANAATSAAEMFLKDKRDLSRFFNYYTSRQLLGGEYATKDLGSTVRLALRAAKTYGLPGEAIWPYDITKWNEKPLEAAYSEAIQHTLGGYYRIRHEMQNFTDFGAGPRTLYEIKHALASGYPVVIGMTVGEKIFTIKDYVYPCTGPANKAVGGHAMVIVGYTPDYFIVANSWGLQYGMAGFFKMAYAAITVDSFDIWTVKGFDGLSTVGPNLVTPYAEPAPVPPIPVPPTPTPDPVPEPPKPPEPEPTPVPPAPTPVEDKKDNTPLIIGAFLLVLIALYFLK
jgi:C1A family cysteine protease